MSDQELPNIFVHYNGEYYNLLHVKRFRISEYQQTIKVQETVKLKPIVKKKWFGHKEYDQVATETQVKTVRKTLTRYKILGGWNKCPYGSYGDSKLDEVVLQTNFETKQDAKSGLLKLLNIIAQYTSKCKYNMET